MKRPWLPMILALAAVAAFGVGLARLFALRFSSGDVYPPYSSLRSDPLGCRVLYESLAALPECRVERNLRPVARIPASGDTVLLFLGDSVSFRPEDDRLSVETVASLNRLMRHGGRVVVTLVPRSWSPDDPGGKAGTNAVPDADADDEDDEVEGGTNRVRRAKGWEESDEYREWLRGSIPLTNWLGTGFALARLAPAETAQRGADAAPLALPESLDCHTMLHFTNAAPDWMVVYRRACGPVVMERAIGQGTLVLSTLSFFASNEALRDARHTGLLVWMLGGRPHVIFDETHHGIQESPGMAFLLRKHRLGWVVLNLLVLAVLFAWRSACTLAPPGPPAEAADAAVGKDSAAGLANLLRRHVPVKGLLAACVAEWKRTAGPLRGERAATAARVAAMAEAGSRVAGKGDGVVETYNELTRMLRSVGKSR